MLPAMMWEGSRAEMDLSLREAELSRDRRDELHLRELQLQRSSMSRRRAEGGYLERSARRVLRAAQAAASWIA